MQTAVYSYVGLQKTHVAERLCYFSVHNEIVWLLNSGMMWIVDNSKNITNSQNSVRKKSFGGTFSFSNCHIIGLDTGSLVLIVFGLYRVYILLTRLMKRALINVPTSF
jgi:hypothetical protein